MKLVFIMNFAISYVDKICKKHNFIPSCKLVRQEM